MKTLQEAIDSYETTHSARVGGDGAVAQAQDMEQAIALKLAAAKDTTAQALATRQQMAQAEFDALGEIVVAIEAAKGDLTPLLPAPDPTPVTVTVAG